MGVVYRALDLKANREVALKVLLGTAQPKRLARLEREGVLSAALRDPGIVQVHDAGEVSGCAYLAFELVPNARTLDEVLPTLGMRGRIEALRDVARALGVAHREGIVHRDVKPQNVLLGDDGRIRVADFGLATASSLESLTQSGALLGTPLYMPPETVNFKRDKVEPQQDVWALGVMLYEALTNEFPFLAASFVELIGLITQGNFTPPREIAPAVPTELEAICLKALEVAPSDRYPDGNALADDLDAWLAGDAVSVNTPSWIRQALGLRKRHPVASAVAFTVPILMLAATALIQVASPKPTVVAQETPASTPETSPTPTPVNTRPKPSAKWLAEGERSWHAIRRDPDRRGRAARAEVWLETFAEHPLAPKVDALAQKDRRRYPRGVAIHTEEKVYATIGCLIDGALITVVNDSIQHRSLADYKTTRSWAFPQQTAVRTVAQRGRGFLAAGDHSVLWIVPSIDPNVSDLEMTKIDLDPKLSRFGELRLLPGGDRVLLRTLHTVIEIDLDSKTEVRRLTHKGRLRALAVTPSGQTVATSIAGDRITALGGSLNIWDLAREERTRTIPTSSTVSALTYLPDGETLVAGFTSGQIIFYTVAGKKLRELTSPGSSRGILGPVSAAHIGRIRGLVPSRDGSVLYSLADGRSELDPGVLRRWSLPDGVSTHSVTLELRPYSMSPNPDRSLLAISAFGGRAEVWSAR
jgi:serine/threonine protein kinase